MSARLSLGRRLKRTRANGTTSAAADYAKGLYNEVVEELDGAEIAEDQQLDIFEDWNSVSFHPQTVANAFNKLARAQSATFHAVALDKMPDEDGNEVPAT
ncbi:MAG TPA: hypothetical protein VLG09_02545, partial [Candidatus Saccharimonadales bacterium]|nr:hypothetical protein [Candidatus Saccharimonadales bacterium]